MARAWLWPALLGVLSGCVAPRPPVVPDVTEVERRYLGVPSPEASGPAGGGGGEGLAPDGVLSEDLAAAWALAARPEVGLVEAELAAVAGRSRARQAYPNPTLEVSARAEEAEALGVPSVWVAWEQPFVLSDRRERGASLSDAEAEVAVWEGVQRELEIAVEARAAFHEVVAAQRRVDLSREALALAEEVQRTAEALLAAERVPETEVLSARAAAEVQRFKVDAAGIELAGARAVLAGVLGREAELPGCRAPEPGDLPPPGESAVWEESLRQSHPALRAARARIGVAEAEARRAEAEGVPDLTVAGAYGQGFDPLGSLWSVSLAVPLPLFDANAGAVAEAEARRRGAELQARALEAALVARLREAGARYRGALAALQSVRETLLPAAREAYRRAEIAYREGRADYLALLEARRSLDEARGAEIDSEHDAWSALVMVESLVGPVAGREVAP